MEQKNLLVARRAFKPEEYPELRKYVQGIRSTYWEDAEIDFTRDKQEFYQELNDTERYIIGTILKTFAQTEVHVADEFWSRLYNYLPKPEILRLGLTNAENEMRHADAYHRLNEELGLEDYEAFLEDAVAKERLENLMKIRRNHNGTPSIQDLCRTLAIFGGFTENVNLFSQFAILKSFSSNGRNLLPNISNIIDWSQQDEKTHALAALHLFKIIKEENPHIWDDEFKSSIYTAAHNTFDIEKHLIDQIFAQGELVNLNKETLLNYMKERINRSLVLMDLKPIYNVNENLLEKMRWFENEYNVLQHADFFHIKPTEYTKNLKVYSSDTIKINKVLLNQLIEDARI